MCPGVQQKNRHEKRRSQQEVGRYTPMLVFRRDVLGGGSIPLWRIFFNFFLTSITFWILHLFVFRFLCWNDSITNNDFEWCFENFSFYLLFHSRGNIISSDHNFAEIWYPFFNTLVIVWQTFTGCFVIPTYGTVCCEKDFFLSRVTREIYFFKVSGWKITFFGIQFEFLDSIVL